MSLSASTTSDMRKTFTDGIAASKLYELQAVKARSATSAFTEELVKQDVTLNQARKSRRLFNETLKEQYNLQKMMAVQWSRSAITGAVKADAFLPKGSSDRVDHLTSSFKNNFNALRTAKRGTEEFSQASEIMRMRLGMFNQVMQSGSKNLINWGKNTQWAGRQLMVGFTVPFAAFAAVSAKAFYDMDKGLTTVAKVYDTTASTVIGKEQELMNLRKQSTSIALQSAKMYGSSVKDTLDAEGQLAATGMRGQDLLKNTVAVQRASTLGQMDYNKTVKAAISLNAVFGQTAEEVGNTFNYMNAMENATSLTMEDFVTALPRVAGTLKNLGGSVQDIGLLMTAMKTQGIEAGEGANAIRSAAAKMVNPNKKAEKSLLDLTHGMVDLAAISQKNGGNILKNFQDLSIGMEQAGLDANQQQKAMVAIFGNYQLNRINAIMTGLRQVTVQGSQMARAFDIGKGSVESWGQVAQSEMDQFNRSASGKFKKAVETIKAEVALIGPAFLKIGTVLLTWVTGVIKLFNKMPDFIKMGAIIAAGLLAVAGPLIMITGLAANMIGQIIKVSATLASLRNGFRAMTPEQKIQKMLADQSSAGWNDQALAAAALSKQLAELTVGLEGVARGQAMAAGMPLPGAAVAARGATGAISQKVDKRGQTYYVGENGKRASASAFAAQEAAAKSSMVIAENSGKAARSWKVIGSNASSLAMGAGMLGSMVAGSNKLVSITSNMLFMAGMFGPMLGRGITKAFGQTAMKESIGRLLGGPAVTSVVSKVARPLMGVISTVGTTLMRFAGPIGIAAAAGLFVWHKVNSEISRARKEQEKLDNSAKDWASVLGFAYITAGQAKDATGKIKSNTDGVKKAMEEANKPLAKQLKMLKDAGKEQEVINAAIREGIKVKQSGGSTADAEAATAASLRVAGYTDQEAKALIVKVKAQIDFSDQDSVIDNQLTNFEKDFDRIAKNHFKQGTWEGFGRAFSGTNDLNARSGAAARDMGKAFWNAFENQDQNGRITFFNNFEKHIKEEQSKLFDELGGDAKDKLSKMGLNNMQQVAQFVFSQKGKNFDQKIQPIYDALGKGGGDTVSKYLKSEEEVVKMIAKENGLTKDQIKGIHTLQDLRKKGQLNMPQMSLNDAQNEYNTFIKNAAMLQKGPLSEAQKLNILNTERAKAGLDAVTDSSRGFSIEVVNNSKILDENGQVMENSAISAEELASAWTDATKSAMSGAQEFAISTAENIRQMSDQAAVDAIQKAGERRQEALSNAADAQNKIFDNRSTALEQKWTVTMRGFDRSWSRRMKSEKDVYDQRIKRIQKGLDAEQVAEEARQKMFEAEKTRLEQLANLQNKNIDFNVQLSQGNMDEAAKIFNDIQATQAGYDISAADQAAADKAGSSKDAKDKQIAAIEAQRDSRLQALQDQEDRERAALEAKKQREKDALDAEKERYQKAVEAQKKALQQQTDNASKAAQRQQHIKEVALNLELQTIRASVPKNVEEYNKQITQIEAAYKKYGVDLTAQGNDWSKTIGEGLKTNIASAAAAMANDIQWKQLAATITAQFTGVFALTPDQFKQWVTTGQFPATAPGGGAGSGRVPGAGRLGEAKHGGGVIGKGGWNRTGYSAGSGMGHDEVGVLAQRGEYMINRRAHDAVGTDFLDSINSGKVPAIGGGNLGMAGTFAAGAAGMMKSLMMMAVMKSGIAQMNKGLSGFKSGGKQGSVKLGADQLANAATIMSVGRGMGASNRDLQIALMTAMQESNLKNINYGDRDSVGLFQQRTSQGWGSIEQIMDPRYAAGKFFEHLLAIKNRGSMSLTQAAQAVQRSAFPDAYAKWQELAASLVGGDYGSVAGGGLGFIGPIAGGQITSRFGTRIDPLTGKKVTHDGTDIAAAEGTPIWASSSGKVIYAGNKGGYGKFTLIKHANGMVSGYGHQSNIKVRNGQNVSLGQNIGSVGSTGLSTGPHLHFMLGKGQSMNSQWQNPGMYVPGMKVGGRVKWDNTLANLHKNETVLTAPLSRKLEDGIDKIDRGYSNEYNVTVDLRGAYIKEEIDIEAGVMKALEKIESKHGRKRKIKD